VFRRLPSPPERDEGEEAPFQPVELADLFEALRRVLKSTAARKPHVLEGEEFSVAEAVRAMVSRLGRVERMPFVELFGEDASRGLIISTFVGLLELIKMGIIEAEQQGRGPIHLRLVDRDSEDAVAQLVETYGQVRHTEPGTEETAA
jgi:segregation and condensation protein A